MSAFRLPIRKSITLLMGFNTEFECTIKSVTKYSVRIINAKKIIYDKDQTKHIIEYTQPIALMLDRSKVLGYILKDSEDE